MIAQKSTILLSISNEQRKLHDMKNRLGYFRDVRGLDAANQRNYTTYIKEGAIRTLKILKKLLKKIEDAS